MVRRRRHLDIGTVDAHSNVRDGVIKNVKLHGDFFGPWDVNRPAEKFQEIKYNYDEIIKVPGAEGAQQHITGTPIAEVADLLT